jgi:glutathione S-transferase
MAAAHSSDTRLGPTETSMPLQIHGRHTSYNVQKVLWLAEELNLEYRHFEVGGRFGGNRTEKFLSMNPQGKVPVLCDGDHVIPESNTILRYLADVYGHGQWMPSSPYQRTLVDRWLDWSIDRLEPAFVQVFWGYYRTPVAHHDHAEIASGVAACDACLQLIAAQLATQSCLAGESLTIADVATGVFLYRLFTMGTAINCPPAVADWYARLQTCAGYRQWVMSDYGELRGRVDY